MSIDKTLLAALLIAGSACAAEKTPAEMAAENAALADRFGKSIVTVQYFVKKDAEGREPKFEVPYKCPNCNGTHWRSNVVSADLGIPAEFAGFLIAPDRVLMKDVRVDPSFVERIAVICGGETRAAAEFEVAPEREALVLKTDTPFAEAKPLAFAADGTAPKDPRYFYLVREDGATMAGVARSKMDAFRRVVETGLSLYEGNPNTLVLNEAGEPVTVALEDKIALGEETFAPPAAWKTVPVAERNAKREAWLARVRRGVLPVYLQLEAKAKDNLRSRFRFSSDDGAKNDIDAIGVVMAGGRVVVLAALTAADTARLGKIEATLPDGTKAPLKFVGSYVEEGAFAAAFEGGVPAGVEPFALDGRAAVELLNKTLDACYVANYGGTVRVTDGTVRADGFKRVRGNVPVAEFGWRSGLKRDYSDNSPMLTFAADGKLVAMEVKSRLEENWKDDEGLQGAQLLALAETTAFDAENVPRASDDRKRTPWLGVEVQVAGPDALREKKATAYLTSEMSSIYAAERAALVTEVASNSPAAQLGIRVGDVLLTAKRPGSTRQEQLSADSDELAGVNWEEAFADERFVEFGSLGGIMPWPNLDGGINETLAKFGVGAEVEIAWVSDGVRKSGTVRLALAPVHYSNAPRVRNKDLSITVCDMTAEVRKYFKLDENAPGVVIAKVKGGGVGAVAGLRPLELILDVNGEGVTSAKDFQEKTHGKKDLSFTVRRLSATRIVPIKL